MNPGITSKYFSGTNTFFARLAEGILRWRWPLMVAILLLTAFFFYEMRGLKMDTSTESLFLEGDQTRITYNKFKEIFGSDDFVYILFETEDFFQCETIRLIKQLAKDLEEHVPYIEDMKFLGNVEYVEGVEGGIEIRDLIEEIPETQKQVEIVRKRAMAEPLYLDNLISRDGKTVAILLECERFPEEQIDPRKDIAPAVYKILGKPEYADLTSYVVGSPVLDYEYGKLATRETPLLGLVCIAVEFLLLLWVVRGFRGAIVPLIVVVMSVFWTLGVVGVIGWTLSMFVTLLPVLLICVGIGDSMHVIAEFHDQQNHGLTRRDAIIRTLMLVGTPCLLTSLTTTAGFLSFLAAEVKSMREMGIYTATGVIMAFVLSMILVPILFSFGRERGKAKAGKESLGRLDLFDKILGGIFSLNIRYPRVILGIFILLAILSLIGYSLVEVENNTIKFMNKGMKTRQAYDYVDSHMGGSMSVEIMLDTGRKDGVKDPKFLQQLEALQEHVNTRPLTMKTISMVDLLKKMRRAMHENRPEFYALPETRDQAAEYLFLYETSGGEELDKQVSFNYDMARLNVRTRSLSTKDIKTFTADIEQFVKEKIDPSIKVEYTGGISMINALSCIVKEGQKRSFTVAFIAITIMMIMVLRSIKLGLISMVPNLFPVLIALGLMGFAGIYISVGLMALSAVIIGVVVDDTIHFFIRYRREFNRTGTYELALKATLLTVGRPITFTTMTLVAGFSVFTLSNLNNTVQFGLVASFAFLWALLADFFLAPAMMLLFKPLGAEKQLSG